EKDADMEQAPAISTGACNASCICGASARHVGRASGRRTRLATRGLAGGVAALLTGSAGGAEHRQKTGQREGCCVLTKLGHDCSPLEGSVAWSRSPTPCTWAPIT